MKEKSLIRNSIYNSIYKGLNVVFPLITSMYVSRILLSDGVGKVASAKNLVTYFTLIAALGIPTYGTKKIAEYRTNRTELEKVFSELFVINLVSTMLCSVAYYSLVSNVGIYNKELYLYYIVGLQIGFNAFNIDWFYQGIEEYGYIMRRSFLVKVLCLLALLVFVHKKEHYLIYAFISVLGVVLNYTMNVAHLRGKIKFLMHGLELRQHMHTVFILLASTIAIEIYTLSDTTMLTAMCDESSVGYYSNSVKSVKTIKELIVAICAVFLPRLSYYYSEGKIDHFKSLAAKGLKTLTFFSMPAALGVFLLSNPIILLLYGPEFQGAILTTQILSVSIFAISLSNFIGYQVLVVTGHERRMLMISLLCAVTNILLNLLLIPHYDQNGAAVASAITELMASAIYYVTMQHIAKIDFGLIDFMKILIPCIGMGIIVLIVQTIDMSMILECVSCVFCGAIAYFVLCLILKNESAIMLKDYLKKIKR